MSLSSLPNLWVSSTIGDVADVLMGQSPPSDTYNSSGVGLPFFQGKAEFGVESPTVQKWCSSPSRIAEVGDILLSVRAPVGPTNIADQRCGIGRGLAAIRPRPDLVDPFYVLHYFRSIESELASLGSGSTFSAINRKDIETFRIPIPPLSEQYKIVSIWRQIDMLRRLRQEAEKKSKDVQRALFYSLIGDPDPDRNNKGWDVVRIGNTLEVGTGGTPSRSVKAYYGGSHNWVKTTELRDEVILNTEETITDKGLANSNAKIYPVNTILVAMYGQGQTRGRTAKLGIPAAVNQACGAFLPSDELLPDYIWHWFQNSYERLRSMSRGGPQENLNLQILKDLYIPKPPQDVQLKFVASIEQYRTVNTFIVESTKKLDELFKSITSKALTGELTASWREKHKEGIQREAVKRDETLGLRDEEPSLVELNTGQITAEEVAKFRNTLKPLLEQFTKDLAISAPAQDIVKTIFQQSYLSEFAKIATQIAGKVILTESLENAVGTLSEPKRRSIADFARVFQNSSPIMEILGTAVSSSKTQTAWSAISIIVDILDKWQLNQEIKTIELNDEQSNILNIIRGTKDYFSAESLSDASGLLLEDVRSTLELFQKSGLIMQVAIADEAISTPEFTIFAPTYRGVRSSDDSRHTDLSALEQNFEELNQ